MLYEYFHPAPIIYIYIYVASHSTWFCFCPLVCFWALVIRALFLSCNGCVFALTLIQIVVCVLRLTRSCPFPYKNMKEVEILCLRIQLWLSCRFLPHCVLFCLFFLLKICRIILMNLNSSHLAYLYFALCGSPLFQLISSLQENLLYICFFGLQFCLFLYTLILYYSVLTWTKH